MNILMRSALQQRVRIGGVNVGSMEINELNYAPEIASGMLKKQQAQVRQNDDRNSLRSHAHLRSVATALVLIVISGTHP